MLHFDGPCDDQLMACPMAQWLITFEKHLYKAPGSIFWSITRSPSQLKLVDVAGQCQIQWPVFVDSKITLEKQIGQKKIRVTWNFFQFCFDVWYLVTVENLMPCTRCLLTPKLNAHERIWLLSWLWHFHLPMTTSHVTQIAITLVCTTAFHNSRSVKLLHVCNVVS